MTREQVYKEIKETLGIVPSFIKALPDSTLELEWKLFVKTQLEEGPIPNKYRELIGLGIAAATKCKYCTEFHKTAAVLNGATSEEIEDALHFAKATSGWSTYVNGLAIDYDSFKKEVGQIADYLHKKAIAV